MQDMDADVLVELWFQHVVVQGIPNQLGGDLLIPIYKSSSNKAPNDGNKLNKSRLSYVAIQVKNCLKWPREEVRGCSSGPSPAGSYRQRMPGALY